MKRIVGTLDSSRLPLFFGFSIVCVGWFLLSVPMYGQLPNGVEPQSSAITLFGSAERPSLIYANEHAPINALLFQTGYEAAYDSNPLGVTSAAQSDEEHRFMFDWQLLHQSPRLAALIEYRPYFEFYQNESRYNRLNQLLSADLTWTLNPHWAARIRDEYDNRSDPFAPDQGSFIASGIGTPSSLNQTIYLPLIAEQENSSRVDLIYHPGLRNVFSMFAGYDDRSISQETGTGLPMYNTRGPNGGVQYAWRSSEHSIIGVLGFAQRLQLSDSLSGQNGAQLEILSLLPTAGWRLTPATEFNIFAGPQFTRQRAGASGTVAEIDSSFEPRWAAGGTIVHRVDSTVLMLSGQHLVTDGGGLLSFVTNSSIDAGLRRRLHGQWNATIDVTAARNRWLPMESGQTNITTASARADFARTLRGNLFLHFGYDFMRETSSGAQAPGERFDRHSVVTGLSWGLRPVPLSH